jgi:hypothetical protein
VKASVPHESFVRGDGGEVPLGVRLLEHELMERLYDPGLFTVWMLCSSILTMPKAVAVWKLIIPS